MLRRPVEPKQYTSWAFTQRAKDSGLVASMGSIGDCYDNAVIESFWGGCRSNCSTGNAGRPAPNSRMRSSNTWRSSTSRRRHSALGMLSPVEYERRRTAQQLA